MTRFFSCLICLAHCLICSVDDTGLTVVRSHLRDARDESDQDFVVVVQEEFLGQFSLKSRDGSGSFIESGLG